MVFTRALVLVALAGSACADGVCASDTCSDDSVLLQHKSGSGLKTAVEHRRMSIALKDDELDDPRLLAYHDAGGCGPMGNDYNVAWCGGANVRDCPDSVETDICPSGRASLVSNQVGGNFAVGDCRYWLYAQYRCDDDPRLLAYHDQGNCGPQGGDHNWEWCGRTERNCPDRVETDICPSGIAHIVSNEVGAPHTLRKGDCGYWLYAQYRCDEATSSQNPGTTADGCPSDNLNRGHATLDQGDMSMELIPTVVHTDAADTASVRCCSDSGTPSCASQVGGECRVGQTLAEAHFHCAADGLRVCTQAEMESNVCCGTGCWFNHHAVWVVP